VRCHRLWLAGASVLCLAGIARLALADADPCTPGKQVPAVAEPAMSARALSARIDALINTRLAAEKVKPAPSADDAEFFRRIYLDVVGRTPDCSEVEDFLDNHDPEKRQGTVERLLGEPGYVKHSINVWRSLLLPQNNNQQLQFLVPNFERWLREKFQDNAAYDDMVREILISPLSSMQPTRRQMAEPPRESPVAFYQANELKPENLAGSTSRLFLGIKLECAQCHNHPHAQWTRNQFWEFASFFAGVEPRGAGPAAGGREVPERRSLKIPGTEKIVLARFLDGKEPQWLPGMQPRAALAVWITASNNDYFARAAVNRIWAQFFGIGLVEPVDDLSDQNPPSHPELLDLLARQFAANHHDIKYLIRALAGSQAYQRTSALTDPSQNDPRLFARMSVKGLSPEQLFDALVQATGFQESGPAPDPRLGQFETNTRARFLARFGNQEKRTEYHTSILQALALMNGDLIRDVTSLERSRTLAAVADMYSGNSANALQTLYLQTLGRKPQAEERDRLIRYIDSGGPKNDRKAALADVFWALLNSAEFFLNH